MPSTTLKRRRTEDGMRGKVPKQRKKVKRQSAYHSSSEDEDAPAGAATDAPSGRVSSKRAPELTGANAMAKSETRKPSKPSQRSIRKLTEEEVAKSSSEEEAEIAQDAPAEDEQAEDESTSGSVKAPDDSDEAEQEEVEDEEEEEEGDSDDVSDASEVSDASTNNPRRVRKRNDPSAFATSISRILNTKLTTQKRSEPILARSKTAQEANKSISDQKLTLKAKRVLLAEKRAAQEKGRVKDVLGLEKEEVSTAAIVAEEKRLRRTAQKGVIKLFNAVRAAQVKAEQAERESRQKGVVGVGAREERVKEMSKQGFLDMIAGGAKKKEASVEA